MIVHFDVDKNIGELLRGDKRGFSVSPKTLSKIKDKDKISIITIKSQSEINKQVLSSFPKLKLIVTRTVGVDHINLSECKKRKIAVYNIPNYGSQHIAQHAIALLLSGARNIIKANEETHKGKFSYKNFLGISLYGKTLGVIGTGRIGLEVIKIAKSLGMKIFAYDIYLNQKAASQLEFTYVKLPKLLIESDAITLHIPATAETKNMINKKAIEQMKDGVILVNTARGDLIDEKELAANIKKFHAVCLDVLENENEFSKNHPLLRSKNIIITPHCAFYTDESLKIIAKETAENIKHFQKGDNTNRLI
ncbi:MAG: NAD(P)-binding domain-containing protein [Patescibacteria group bacterium]|nr:NAD(P)-binding domain-containing protein [Patescibacteria group bacterium]